MTPSTSHDNCISLRLNPCAPLIVLGVRHSQHLRSLWPHSEAQRCPPTSAVVDVLAETVPKKNVSSWVPVTSGDVHDEYDDQLVDDTYPMFGLNPLVSAFMVEAAPCHICSGIQEPTNDVLF